MKKKYALSLLSCLSLFIFNCSAHDQKINPSLLVEKIVTNEKLLYENENIKNINKHIIIEPYNNRIDSVINKKLENLQEQFSLCTQEDLEAYDEHYDCINNLIISFNKHNEIAPSQELKEKCSSQVIKKSHEACKKAHDNINEILNKLRT